MVSELGSQPKGHGFDRILHGNGIKTMPGSIPVTPNPGSENRDI